MAIAKLLKKIADWLDRHFPEKMTTDEIRKLFQIFHEESLQIKKDIEDIRIVIAMPPPQTPEIKAMQAQITQLFKELDAIKTLTSIKSRISPSGFGVPNPLLKPEESKAK